MRVICAGGGTAGHINPALAIANNIAANDKDSEFLFIGTKKGMEKELVPKAGYNIEFIEVEGFSRRLTISNLKVILKAGLSIFKAKKIIKKFKPDIVIGTGGYVSGPVLFAAAMLKIPTLIHEQNVFAGMTSRMLSKIVNTTCISFGESEKAFAEAKKVVLTGNPLRSEIFGISKSEARKELGVDERPLIVAFGGSLGARALNKAVVEFIKKHKENSGFQMIYATGNKHYNTVMEQLSQPLPGNIRILPYIYNMAEVINAADLLICRSGAITLSEITALGKASVLIPSPNVTDNHQHYNAMALGNVGAAVVITEQQMKDNPKLLNDTIIRLTDNRGEISKMEASSKELGISDGAERIYAEIKALLQ